MKVKNATVNNPSVSHTCDVTVRCYGMHRP